VSRAIDLRLEPARQEGGTLRLSAYTYRSLAPYAEMSETVYLEGESAHMRALVRLTPDEARVLANQLLQVADVADESRALRESYEQIQEELARAAEEGRDTGCLYAHPWVHYVSTQDEALVGMHALKEGECGTFLVRPQLTEAA
jgi:hypothetical protein